MTIADGTIEVQASVAKAYAAWTRYEELPAFLGDVVGVRRLDDTHLLFAAEPDGGPRREWHAVITDERRNERVSWKSQAAGPGEAVTVTFEDAGDGRTRVGLELDVRGPHEPPFENVEQRVRRDLQAFKRVVEGHAQSRSELEGQLEPGDSVQGMGRPGPGGGA